MNLSLNELLKYSNAQMAAEAFLINEENVPRFNNELLEGALTRGNDHNSRFTSDQAREFSAHWEVAAHKKTQTRDFQDLCFVVLKTILSPEQKKEN